MKLRWIRTEDESPSMRDMPEPWNVFTNDRRYGLGDVNVPRWVWDMWYHVNNWPMALRIK